LNITVLGCGRWGAFLAWYLKKNKHNVLLWGRSDSESFQTLKKEGHNEYLQLQEGLILSSSLKDAVSFGRFIIIAISAQNLRSFAKQLSGMQLKDKTLILCMKGIESGSGKRLSEVLCEEIGTDSDIAVWVGSGHVQDFVEGIHNCMVIDSNNTEVTKKIVDEFGSELIRFYYGQDMTGNEIGAASKNVIGIAAGMLDGLNCSSLKGALMARGAREISCLVRAMGGNGLTVYGLSHLGDYGATLFSQYSHNRRFGEEYIKGNVFNKLAEGVHTSSALKLLSGRFNVELPISNAVHSILFEKKEPKKVLLDLIIRPLKYEF
jgi:glycerol-3-phosphate dehydrogenase (NAD(P)+)